MRIETYYPNETLKPFIKAYKVIESLDGAINNVLPDTSLAISFRYKGQINFTNGNQLTKLPAFTFSGLRRSVRLINYLPQTATIVVLLKEAGAAAFFKGSFHEIFEQSIPMENFMTPNQQSILEEQLAEAIDNIGRVSIIEQFFVSKLKTQKADLLINQAVHAIQVNSGNIKIKDLSMALNMSQDAFEKRFRRSVGASPKQYSSIVRLRLIINKKNNYQQLSSLALDAGFYDQSHFIKEFKLFTGQTPSDFFRLTSYW